MLSSIHHVSRVIAAAAGLPDLRPASPVVAAPLLASAGAYPAALREAVIQGAERRAAVAPVNDPSDWADPAARSAGLAAAVRRQLAARGLKPLDRGHAAEGGKAGLAGAMHRVLAARGLQPLDRT